MTFGAMAAWQAWTLLAVAGAAAAALFLIKLRPPRVLIPSLLLWRRVLDESRETTMWERIRRVVSLIVTILIAVALAFAVARPARAVSSGAGVARGRVLIVLDSSWSMLAHTKSGETRWDRAIAEARRIASSASGDNVALATTADGLVEGPTPDAALIETALDRLAPAGADASSWPRVAGGAAVHFITDGNIARPIDADVVVHSVFEAAPNAAITAFDIRPAPLRSGGADLYFEIANFASAPQNVRLRLNRGTMSLLDRQVDVAAGETIRQVVPLARNGDRKLQGRISAANDALEADDEALAWIDWAQPLSVLIVGDDTAWLQTLFSRNGDVRITVVRPAAYRAGEEDVTIFDGWAPAEAPSHASLLIAPPANDWLGPAGEDERRLQWAAPGSHPVLQGVDPFTMAIDKAHAYGSPTLNPIARSTKGTPLVYVHDSAPRRVVVLTFGHRDSNLAFAPALPVLMGNALDWLARPEARRTHAPGPESFEASTDKLVGPNGAQVSLLRVGGATVGRPHAPGLYTVEGGGARSTIAVNVGDPQISNLERTSLTAGQRDLAVAAGAGGRPWWLYGALLAFVFGLAEWWTWLRRITV